MALGIALDKSPTHASTASLSWSSGLVGSFSSRHSWNLVQSARLKSGRSGRVRKLERHVLSISTGRWSELSSEQTVRLNGVTMFLVKAMFKTSGWQMGCKELLFRRPECFGLYGGKHNLQTGRLPLGRDEFHLRGRCRHRAAPGSVPAPASCPGRRRRSSMPPAGVPHSSA